MRPGWLVLGGVLFGIQVGVFVGAEVAALYFGADMHAASHPVLWIVSGLLIGAPLYQALWFWSIRQGMGPADGNGTPFTERGRLALHAPLNYLAGMVLLVFGMLDARWRWTWLLIGFLLLNFGLVLHCSRLRLDGRAKRAIALGVVVSVNTLVVLVWSVMLVRPFLIAGSLFLGLLAIEAITGAVASFADTRRGAPDEERT